MLFYVGAGQGVFVSVAIEEGWDALGIEPSTQGVEYSQNNLAEGIIMHSVLDDLVGKYTFDVITMWDVIEHVDNPYDLIRTAKKLLNKNGALVIETGNYMSVERVSMGDEWYLWQKDHRWYYSQAFMAELCEKEGYSDFYYAEKSLRPNKIKQEFKKPSLLRLAKNILRNPFGIKNYIKEYRQLINLYKNWYKGASVAIFTIAMRLVN